MAIQTDQRQGESTAVEDYLDQIYHLIEQKKYAWGGDIAAKLDMSQARLTNMTQELDNNRRVVFQKFRGLDLTPEGERIGREIRHQHGPLEQFGWDKAPICMDVEGNGASHERADAQRFGVTDRGTRKTTGNDRTDPPERRLWCEGSTGFLKK